MLSENKRIVMFVLLFIVALASPAFARANVDTVDIVIWNGFKTIIMAICLGIILLPWLPLPYEMSDSVKVAGILVLAFLIVLVLNAMKDSSAIWATLIIGAIISFVAQIVKILMEEQSAWNEREKQQLQQRARLHSAASRFYNDKGLMERLTAQAQQGDATAQFQLATVYIGMEDEAVGMHWLREAASRHDPKAIRMLNSIEAREREADAIMNDIHERDLLDEQRRENDRVIKELDKRAEARRSYHSLTDQIVKDLFH